MKTRSWTAWLLWLAACGTQSLPEKPLTPVRVQTVANVSSAASAGARYSATIEPNARVDLAFKVGGYVQELFRIRGQDGKSRDIQEGDVVVKGAVLAQVRTSDYDERVNQARSQMAEASAALDQARSDAERAERLYGTGSLTKPDFDMASTRMKTAQARADSAKAQLQQATLSLGDTSLRSPMDGVVLQRTVEVGSLVAPGSVGFSLADISSVKAVFGVPDFMVQRLTVGGPISVTTEAVPGTEFQGQISQVSPAADAKSHVFEVEVTIPNPDGRLKSGLIAALQVPAAASAEPSLVVPLTSVVRPRDNPDGYAVYVLERQGARSRARLRVVELGDILGNGVAVQGGLKVGEEVVVVGASFIADGEQVQVNN